MSIARCLLEHHMYVGATDSEGAHPGTARSVSRGPVDGVDGHTERAVGKVEQRILGGVMQIRGDYTCSTDNAALMSPATPAAASVWPMFVLALPSRQYPVWSVDSRNALVSADTSMGSPSGVPVP